MRSEPHVQAVPASSPGVRNSQEECCADGSNETCSNCSMAKNGEVHARGLWASFRPGLGVTDFWRLAHSYHEMTEAVRDGGDSTSGDAAAVLAIGKTMSRLSNSLANHYTLFQEAFGGTANTSTVHPAMTMANPGSSFSPRLGVTPAITPGSGSPAFLVPGMGGFDQRDFSVRIEGWIISCCCLAVNLSVKHEPGVGVGKQKHKHLASVTAELDWLPSNEFLPCELQWWEMTNVPYEMYDGSGWVKAPLLEWFQPLRKNSPAFDEWRKVMSSCDPGGDTVTIRDSMGFTPRDRAVRKMWVWIRLKSGCPGGPTKELKFYVKLGKADPDDKDNDTTPPYWPDPPPDEPYQE